MISKNNIVRDNTEQVSALSVNCNSNSYVNILEIVKFPKLAPLAHRMYCLKYLNNVEAATGGVMLEKVFLEIWQNSQENTCASNNSF